jgi:hypothetical protein
MCKCSKNFVKNPKSENISGSKHFKEGICNLYLQKYKNKTDENSERHSPSQRSVLKQQSLSNKRKSQGKRNIKSK